MFSTLSALHVKLLVRIIYCTCWALAHIVHVVGTSDKQPLVRNWRDTCWCGTGGRLLGRRGRHMKVLVCVKFAGLYFSLIL